LAFPFDVLSSQHVVFDMVYRPLYTELIKEAQKRNCTVITGIEMLVEQAVLQFELWTGIPAPVDVMRNAIEKVLKQCDI